MLAKISTPTSGSVKVNGGIAPLIEVGAGFVPDFTGRENVYLNGAILGMSRQEIEKKFDEIVDFAEMAEFIDTPVKRYSSGMQVKLAFAVATSVEAEILIVDEVLAVGDLAFQRKCFDRMEDLIKRQRKTVLLVSHNIRQVERLCDRVLLFDHGKKVADGKSNVVCNLFMQQSNDKIMLQSERAAKIIDQSEDVVFSSMHVVDGAGSTTTKSIFLQPVTFRLTFNVTRPLQQATFYIGLHTPDLLYLTAHNTAYEPRDLEVGEHIVELNIRSLTLLPGTYCVLAWVGSPAGQTFFYGENLATFQVASDDYAVTRQSDRALVYMDAAWTFGSDTMTTDRRTIKTEEALR